MKKTIALLIITTLIFACSQVKEKAKETINNGGEVVGKTATEFIDGVTEGVDKTLECQVVLSQDLKDKGLKTGKYLIENDTNNDKKNLLTLYLIFDKDLKKDLSLKVFDKSGLEYGRTKLQVQGKANDARYFRFVFDKQTDIEKKSKIEVE